MPIIIGIDPGSIRTGYGIIRKDKQQITHIAHGCIAAKGDDIAERLCSIYQQLSAIIAIHQPNEAAIEQVFVKLNIQSALKLGQARGAALVALAQHSTPVSEYSARQIKKTTVGYGAATKTQVQYMIRSQLKLQTQLQADAADALAIAICHCQHKAFLDTIQ